MTKRLKAAEPTIVDGPSSGGTASMSFSVEITDAEGATRNSNTKIREQGGMWKKRTKDRGKFDLKRTI